MTAIGRFVGIFALALGLFWSTLAAAQVTIVAGMGDGEPTVVPVPFSPVETPGVGSWLLNANLIFDPGAPGMIKEFGTPRWPTGEPIVLHGLQPMVFPVDENFSLPLTAPTKPVSDWHEIILTPGWEWVLPGSRLYPTDISLITRDGVNWPWEHVDPSNLTPQEISVVFEAIEGGHVLDIHKGLLWVGTPDDLIWGDEPDETVILVREYPTPEPASWMLAAVGLTTLAGWRWRRGRRATVC